MKLVALLNSDLPKEIAGSKAYNLSFMIKNGFNVPNGFVVFNFEKNKEVIKDEIRDILGFFDADFLAVRSSANVEDSEQYSFAGIFDSYLNVEKKQLLESISRCFSTLESTRLKHYVSKCDNISHSDINLSILVQEMVNPTLSGVAFSCDPINNDDEVIYIEAIYGLGEHLVQGEQDASIKAWIDKRSKTILRCDFANTPEIPETILNLCIMELASQVIKVEELFGTAQDVEWAVDAEYVLWFLQARPITSSNALSKPVLPNYLIPGKPYTGWFSSEIKTFQYWDEYNSLSIFPLEWDLYEKYLFHTNLTMLSCSKNILNIMCFYESVPVCMDPRARITSHDTINFSVSPILNWDKALNEWETKKTNYLKKIEHTNSDITSCFKFLVEISFAYAKMRAERMLSMFWIDKITALKKEITGFIEKKLPTNEIEYLYDGLTQHIEHETYLMDKLIYEIQLDFFNSKSIDYPRLESFFEKYGHVRYDNTSLFENKDVFISEFFSSCIKPKEQFLLSEKKYYEAIAKIKSLNPSKDLIESIQNLRYWIGIRETSKTNQDILFPLINGLIYRLACMLNLKVDEIKLLTLYELENIVDTNFYPKKVLDRQKIVNWKKNNSWLPDSLLPTLYTKESIVMVGDGCSHGEVEKPIKVLKSIEDFSKITDSEIAVVYKTDPSWTPLFSRISGIIVEKGSRLSHAAIVAREMNIPAIVGINGITKFVSDDEIVYMNGQTGLIERLIRNK